MDENNHKLLDICNKLPFKVVETLFNYHQEHAYYFMGGQARFDELKDTVHTNFSGWELHKHVSEDYYLVGDYVGCDFLKSIRVRKYTGEDEFVVDLIFLLNSMHHEENVLVARISSESFDLDKLIQYLNGYFKVKLGFTVFKESYEHRLTFPKVNGNYISDKQISISLDKISSIMTTDQLELISVLTSEHIVEIEFGNISLEEDANKIEKILGVENPKNNLFIRKFEKKSDLVKKTLDQLKNS